MPRLRNALKRFPGLRRSYHFVWRAGRELAEAGYASRFYAREGMNGWSGRSAPRAEYAPQVIDSTFPPLAGHDGLLTWLNERRLTYEEGAFTVYLPPQDRLSEVFPALAGRHPPDAGIKFLKDLGPAETSRYVPIRAAWSKNTWSEALAIGRPAQQLVGANALHLNGLGPRVYDLVTFRSEHARVTAFIVKHVDGAAPSAAQCGEFLARLDRAVRSKQLAVMLQGWRSHPDFRCPSCNGNLIASEDAALYVDFQTFRIPTRDGSSAGCSTATPMRDGPTRRTAGTRSRLCSMR